MAEEVVRADELQDGDLIFRDDARWEVTSHFVEGSQGTMSIDLVRDDDSDVTCLHVLTSELIIRVG